jgi:O-antigen/teichoic acid export membrane protein
MDQKQGATSAEASTESSAGDMLFGMGSKLLYALTRVALPPLALAHMGLGDYGLWSTCFVLVSYIGMAASGFSLIYLRGAAQAHHQGDVAAIGRLLSTGMMAMGSMALLLLGGLWLAMPHLLSWFNVPPEQHALAIQLWLGATTVFLADMSVGAFAHVLHAIGQLRAEQKIWVGAFVLEAVLIVTFLSLGWGALGLLAAFAGRYLFSTATTAWATYQALPDLRLSLRSFDRRLLRGFFVYGAGMQASGLIATALGSIDRLLAGALIGPQATAMMDLALKLPSTAAQISSSAAGVAVSAAARHDAGGHDDAVRRVYTDAMRMTVACLALTMPFLAVFSAPLMLAWLGAGSTAATAAPLMTLMALCLHLHLLTGPATSVARGRGQLGPDFAYHAVRALTLAVALGLWSQAKDTGLFGFALAIAGSQSVAATVFFAWTHRQICGTWHGLGRPVAWPTLLAYGLALLAAWALPDLAGAGRPKALLSLAGMALLWLPPTALVLGAWLLSPAEREPWLRRLRLPLNRTRPS